MAPTECISFCNRIKFHEFADLLCNVEIFVFANVV